MMPQHTRRAAVIVIVAVVVALGLVPAGGVGGTNPRFLISAPPFELQKGERIKEFQLEVTRGRIVALPQAPWPWKLKLVNDDNDRAELHGVALADLGRFKPAFFTDFVEVELLSDAELRLKIETTLDWQKMERRLVFEDTQLVRKPVGG